MSRLIDADALIDEICREECERKYEDCDYHACSSVKPVVNAPTIGEWISVKTRLPEKSMRCITASHRGAIQVHDYSAQWKAFNAFDGTDENIVKKYNVNAYIEYWMPVTVLPGLPGSESK